jgi:uncharacterized membrane protein
MSRAEPIACMLGTKVASVGHGAHRVHRPLRTPVLVAHGGVVHLFGTAIIAMTINVVASLAK